MNMNRKNLLAALVGIVALGLFAADASAMYNPAIGTFMSRDPGAGAANRIGGAGSTAVEGAFIPRDQYADGMNLYQSVRSNPIQNADPSGLTTFMPVHTRRTGKRMWIKTNWCCDTENAQIKVAAQLAFDTALVARNYVWDWRDRLRSGGLDSMGHGLFDFGLHDRRVKNFFWNGWQDADPPMEQREIIATVVSKTADMLATPGFSCGGTGGSCAGGGDAYAWTDFGSKGGDMLLCHNFFYKSPRLSVRDQVTEIIHEATHAAADTTDAGGGFQYMYATVQGGLPFYTAYEVAGGILGPVGWGFRSMSTGDRLKHADTYASFIMEYYSP